MVSEPLYMKKFRRLLLKYGDAFDRIMLPVTQRQIALALKKRPMSTREVADMFEMSLELATNKLRYLEARGYVEKKRVSVYHGHKAVTSNLWHAVY